MLHTLLIVTFVLGTIRPLLKAVAMLFVLVPVSLVSGAVEVRVDTEAISLVLSPLSLVDVALSVDQPSKAIGHTVAPKAVITRAIGPNLNTATILLLGGHQPLSLIHGAVLQDLDGFDCPLLSLIDFVDAPVKRLKLLNDLLENG